VDTQVVIAGAGPVGLLLAGELRLGGAEVVLVDRLTEPSTESRASTLHARTMELFDQRGLLGPLGTPPNDVMGHFGGLGMSLAGLPSPFPGQWKVPQTRTEALLSERARGLGADLRRGHELTGLTRHEDHVEVELSTLDGPARVRASYLVGCDGERSTVGNLGGFAFSGEVADKEMLRADVAGIEIPDRRFERFPAGLAVASRRPDGVTRVMVHEFGRPIGKRRRELEFDEVAEVWQRVTGEDIAGGSPVWVNAFDNTSRQADRYRLGRVFLAGDAAHAQMPVGGQALNLGLQDAANLGWKLAAAVAGWAPEGLLDTYHAERHEVGARVLANIRAQALVLLGGGEVEPVRGVLAELLEYDPVRARLAATVGGLDIRYDTGPGVHPLLGARIPPEGTRPGSARLLRSGRGVLLDFTDSRCLAKRAESWADRIDTATAEAAPDGPLAGIDAVLVRPDGHVVWVAGDGTDVESALRRWFGAEGRAS
jgi:2-polyprenyl-6-methoxyphenol hydroxylase-like FAD-dependent oxidoreductase